MVYLPRSTIMALAVLVPSTAAAEAKTAQEPAPEPGRMQAVAGQTLNGQGVVLVIDTATGRAWVLAGELNQTPALFPVPYAKERSGGIVQGFSYLPSLAVPSR